jgi:hypothetical protein
MLSRSKRKLWIAVVVVVLSWASIESDQVFASKTYLTDEIGEGSVFHLDSHLHSQLLSGSEIYLQDGHSVAAKAVDPEKPFCSFKLKSKSISQLKSGLVSSTFTVQFANAASPHWFFRDLSELECRHIDTAEEFGVTVQGLVSVEKHRELRTFSPIAEVSKN